MIKKLHHAVVSVSDMDQALSFYRDKLGLKVRVDFEVHGAEFDALMGEPGVRGRIVYFEENLELAYFYSPSDGRPLTMRPWDKGATFLVFEVDDLTKTCSELEAKGVEFFAPPQVPEMDAPTVGKIPVAHVRAPDGVRISLTTYETW
jgi:catechol 2,3-dioxygenase-like lactoylglutathione lyase family enzyme